MPTINPFFHRGPVRDPAYFFGRSQEHVFVTELLRTGQSIAVSGARRLGKTSLLFQLAHPDVAVTLGLGGEADAVPYSRFVERLRTLANQGLRLILWPDEVAPDPKRARGVVKKLCATLGLDGEAIVNRHGQSYLLALDGPATGPRPARRPSCHTRPLLQ